MSQVEITVRGRHLDHVPPERATVRLQVGLEGDEAGAVYAGVAAVATDVRRSVEALHRPDDGPVTEWSSDQIRTWSDRPWNQDGKQLPLVHHAQALFRVEFSDFIELSRWLTTIAGLQGTSVGGVGWALTPDRERELMREVRTAAVADARSKAEDYAAALGLGEIRVIAVADAGMLGTGPPEGGVPGARMARLATHDAAGDVELAPRPVALAAEVDARFLAG